MTRYLEQKMLHTVAIKQAPSSNLGLIVVIPCFDEPDILPTFQSLVDCELPDCDVEVILVVNNSRDALDEIVKTNLATHKIAQAFSKEKSTERLQFYSILKQDMPPKHAGVGLARKIGMDEATYRLETVGRSAAVIACYDADSRCDPSYLREIEAHFKNNPKTDACSIYYEHPTSGASFTEEIYSNIIDYELHLRYYVDALRWAGFPLAYQTIGSSMAVRCDAYQRQGGMNRRKAGEDFYFLHKFIPLGNFSELNSTRVIPSPRPSHRVPFGTGKAVQDMLDAKDEPLQTYSLESFKDLTVFLSRIAEISAIVNHSAQADLSDKTKKIDTFLDNLPPSIGAFLKTVSFQEKVLEISKHTSNEKTFNSRFFQWFSAFLVLKFVHFARDHHYPNVLVSQAAGELAQHLSPDGGQAKSNLVLLTEYREKDRSGS